MNKKQYTPLFSGETFDRILERTLDQTPTDIDKREGSIIYDAMASTSIELAVLYGYLDFILKNSFGNTANRYWLIERAKERGIEPHPATASLLIGKFNKEIPHAYKFSLSDLIFKVEDYIKEAGGFFYYSLRCETNGKIGNISGGRLTPKQNIDGLTTAEVVRIAIPGEDEEETEAFRERYYRTIKNYAYGGNIDDYILKTKAIPGVGGVRVIPVWNGGGTVKIIIIDSDYNAPSPELIEEVQEKLDPVPHQQKGVGIAPIGHRVTVTGVENRTIDLTISIMKTADGNAEKIKRDIKKDIENYFSELKKNWEKPKDVDEAILDKTVIRLSKILSIVLNTEGVKDYSECKFIETEEKLITLDAEEIPVAGSIGVTITE